jgi:hypothetical protein
MPLAPTSTLFPYSQHFVDLMKNAMTKSTKCCLTAAGSPLPYPAQLTFAGYAGNSPCNART